MLTIEFIRRIYILIDCTCVRLVRWAQFKQSIFMYIQSSRGQHTDNICKTCDVRLMLCTRLLCQLASILILFLHLFFLVMLILREQLVIILPIKRVSALVYNMINKIPQAIVDQNLLAILTFQFYSERDRWPIRRISILNLILLT